MWRHLSPAFRMMLLLTALTGLVYPGVVTLICHAAFPREADGSLIVLNGGVAGSSLIGQNFSRPEYFHPRPSVAGDGYDPTASGGSNYGPTSQKLIERVKSSVESFHQQNPGYAGPVPADIATASGSGLDPDISPASAEAQARRVAQARKMNVSQIQKLIEEHTQGREWNFLGEPRVNVLQLNLALDRTVPHKTN